MANTNIKIVYGGGTFSADTNWSTPEAVKEVLEILDEHGVNHIDTAQSYPNSEELLGRADAASRFLIATKDIGALAGGTASKQDVIVRGEASLKKLNMDKLDILYLHAPDRKTPLAETLAGVNELYKAGKFSRLGLSNFRANEVEEVVRIAEENNYIIPTVYQGLYSAVTRRQEKELFPTLRKLGIAFYAYSPLAGGFLVKSKKQILENPKGRWDPNTLSGKIFAHVYGKTELLDSLEKWEQISKESEISKAELGYRWVAYHSYLKGELGDAIIIGASSHSQLKQTLEGLKNGPLEGKVVRKIEEFWQLVETAAPLDFFNDFLAFASF
ncbi:putative aldehyde reductase [Aspergillus cavernicola]|uniref:Aldehyde reductase n=1 Tax=Aspergillus cavernicola TaxID=176166 RepID=A0ABR4IK37_9EURO